MASRYWIFLGAGAIVAGCYTGSAVDTNRPAEPVVTSTDGTDAAPAGNTTPGSNVHGLTHLPCDVEKVLSDACWECHGTVPGYGATTSIVYYSDLTATTPIGLKEADLCLIRMQSTGEPMPPDKPATAAQTTTIQNWINAGYPEGHCGEADAGADAASDAAPATGDDDDAG